MAHVEKECRVKEEPCRRIRTQVQRLLHDCLKERCVERGFDYVQDKCFNVYRAYTTCPLLLPQQWCLRTASKEASLALQRCMCVTPKSVLC